MNMIEALAVWMAVSAIVSPLIGALLRGEVA